MSITSVRMKHALLFILSLSVTLSLFSQPPALKPEFGKGGNTIVNFYERTNDNYVADAITITNENRIQLGGAVDYEAMINALTPGGKDDTLFGQKGFSFYDGGRDGDNRIEEVLKVSGNKTILIGHLNPTASQSAITNNQSSAIVIRLLANGTQDTSFGIKGKVMILNKINGFNGLTGIEQPDGKIIVAGHGNTNNINLTENTKLVRINIDGTIDNQFGQNGFLTVPQYSGTNTLNLVSKMSISLQPDGKIILGDLMTETIFLNGGYGTQESPAVYRILSTGIMDSSFGVKGMFFNRFGFANYGINRVIVQPDGKILVGGNVNNSTGNRTSWLMFRLNNSGRLDSSFATTGLFTYNLNDWVNAAIGDMAISGGNKIVVSATHGTSAGGVLDVFSLKPDGTFDSTFAQSAVIFQQPMMQDYYFSYSKLAVDNDSNFAVLGYSYYFPFKNGSNIGHIVLRLSKDGVPMTSFNNTGFKLYYNRQLNTATDQFNYGSYDVLRGMVQLKSGRIILAGEITVNNDSLRHLGLAALTPRGKIDSSFGVNGRLKPFEPAYLDHINIFCVLNDSKILINRNNHLLYKIDSNGKIDSSFGEKGFVTLPTAYAQLFSAVQQPDGKILVLSNQSLYRLQQDGKFDNSFGVNGELYLQRGFGLQAQMVKLQPDGKILIATKGSGSNNFVNIFRCTASGIPDNTFGPSHNGFAAVNVDIPKYYELLYDDIFKDFQILPDGKILVLSMKDRSNVSTAVYPGFPDSVIKRGAPFRDFMLFRLLPDGNIDPSFGGYPVPSVYKGTSHLYLPFLESIPATLNVNNSSGSILLSGYFNRGAGWDIGLVQLKPNGTYDTTCTFQGMATLGDDNILEERFFSGDVSLSLFLKPQPDGSYLLAGTRQGQGPDFYVKNISSPEEPLINYSFFNAERDTGCLKTNLSWQTDLECGLDSFYVEYSRDSVTYSTIATIKAEGSLVPQGNYRLLHLKANYGSNYYRLRTYHSGILYQASTVNKVFIDSSIVAQIKWADIKQVKKDSVFDLELKWFTLQENGSISFQVQESLDSLNFHTIGVIPASGTSSGMNNYSFPLKGLPDGRYYFRILAMGSECRISQNVIAQVLLKGCADKFNVYPNPVHELLTVEIPACEPGDIHIMDAMGNLLKIIKNPPGKFIIDFRDYHVGPYFIQFSGGNSYIIKVLKL